MKSAWIRLSNFVLNKGEDTRFMESRFENLFVRHHQNACELVYNKDRKILAAIYLIPTGSNQEEVKNLMRLVKERVQWGCDNE